MYSSFPIGTNLWDTKQTQNSSHPKTDEVTVQYQTGLCQWPPASDPTADGLIHFKRYI